VRVRSAKSKILSESVQIKQNQKKKKKKETHHIKNCSPSRIYGMDLQRVEKNM
jgi:hypothetical protein